MTWAALVREDSPTRREHLQDGGDVAVGGTPGSPDDADAAKSALRTAHLAARRALSPAELTAAAAALRDRALQALELPATLALYASTGTEPGTHLLLEALRGQGVRVLLPVLLPDLELDWGVYRGPEFLVPGPRGTVEPEGPTLGRDALGSASLVLVPGVAADRSGHRLGRGGGSYDRALRLAEGRVVVVLYAAELVPAVPVRPHDIPVDGILTPDGLTWV